MPPRTVRRAPRATAVPPAAATVAESVAPGFASTDGDAAVSRPPSADAERPVAAGPPPSAGGGRGGGGGQQPPGYRGLKVWQRAMDLAAGVHLLARTLPDEEQGSVGAELRRTALQIPAHVAAGNALFHRGEYVQHLSAAHGAVARLESLLLVGERVGLLGAKAVAGPLATAGDVGRLLRGLVRALQPPPPEDAATAGGGAGAGDAR